MFLQNFLYFNFVGITRNDAHWFPWFSLVCATCAVCDIKYFDFSVALVRCLPCCHLLMNYGNQLIL